jgi:hypothetical protein
MKIRRGNKTMTENEKQLVKKFFELKAKQLICKVWLMINQKPGYTNDEVGLMMKVLEVQHKLEDVESEIFELLKANETFFMNSDLNELSKEQEFKVSFDKQKEFSKELLGYETTIEDLIEKLERRG